MEFFGKFLENFYKVNSILPHPGVLGDVYSGSKLLMTKVVAARLLLTRLVVISLVMTRLGGARIIVTRLVRSSRWCCND